MALDPVVVKELLTFLRSNDVAVLATIKSGNIAHATTIYFYAEDDLTFYFLTRNETMKFNNIKANNSVALVVSDPVTLQTVQVEGKATEVDYTRQYAGTMKKFTDALVKNGQEWDKIPINHMASAGYYSFVRITPGWIRWTDYKQWEHTVKFEAHFS